MTLPPGREFLFYVTHVDTDGPLLRVWGQIEKDAAVKIESLIVKLNERFQKGFGAVSCDTQLVPYSTCCAYHDDGFYRARIQRPISPNGTVQVQFIDYGNQENVPYQNVRLLNETEEGIQLQVLPPVAMEFILADVLPLKSGWDPSLVEHIKQTLRYNEMPAVVCSVLANKKRMLKVFFNGEDYAEYMINKRMAMPATSDDVTNLINTPPPTPQPPMYRQTRPHPPHYPPQPYPPRYPPDSLNNPYNNNNFHQKSRFPSSYQSYSRPALENWRQPSPGHQQTPGQALYVAPRHYNQNPAPIPRPLRSPVKSTPKTAHSMVNRVLKYKRYPVLVSYVEDGPLKFAVQPEENLGELNDLTRQINSCPLKLLSEPPIPGSVCLGRYSVDGTIRRAVVRSVTDSLQAKVFYIDYGSSEILSHSDIYELPVEFAHPYVFSVRFTLSGVKYLIVSDEMKRFFQELVEGKRMILDVVPPEDSPLMQYGHLWNDEKNVLDILVERFPGCTETWPEGKTLNRGATRDVHVCYVEACSKFYVQLDTDAKVLEKLTETIDECIKTAPPVKPGAVQPGYKCLALCQIDSQWYRVKVLRVTGNQVTVHYVDYGNDEIIPVSALRVVGGDVLTRVPALAIKCALNGFQGKGLIDGLDTRFENMVMDKVLQMVVLEQQNDRLVVNLVEKVGEKQVLDVSAEIRGVCKEKSAVEVQQKSAVVQGSTGRGRSEEPNWAPSNPPKKTWKDEENHQKRQDFQTLQHQPSNEWTNPPQSNQFPPQTRNDRPPRDHPRQNHSENPPVHSQDTFRPPNPPKLLNPPPRPDRNPFTEKNLSDRDSDTSSRSSGRHGDRPPRGGSTRPPRNDYQRSPRDSESSESNFKAPRLSNHSTNSNYPPERAPRDSVATDRRPSESRDSRRPPSTPSPASSTPSTPPRPSKPPQLKIPPPNITLGAIKTCELTYIVSPLDFSVVLLPDFNELEGVMTKISEIYESGGQIMPKSSIKLGTDCIAQYSVDSAWYRASVEEITPAGAKVLFVDYANAEVVPFDKIKQLQEEVCKLPAQAVRVKLLAAVEKDWTPEEIDVFTSLLEFKTLEAEFVGLEGKTYEVLIREVVDGVPSPQYINEKYSDGADLMQAKELSRNKSRKLTRSRRSTAQTDYAPMDAKWKEPAVDLEGKLGVMVTWLKNPHNFYCQALSAEKQFREMMNRIQKAYVGRKPVEEPLEVGTAVMAVFDDDGAIYRAEVLDLNKLRGNIVRYVDFGNCAMVEPKKTFRVEKEFLELPKQAFNCTLKNVVPVSGNWAKGNSQEIEKLFNVDNLECCFHDVKDNKYTVSMMMEGKDLAGVLVEKGLADFAVASVEEEVVKTGDDGEEKGPEQPVRIDISRLEGQSLRVKVSSVEGVGRFHVLLPSAGECEKGVAEFMAGKDPEMLALPTQLAVMQNQAVECYVKNATSDPDADKKFKAAVENKEVIVRVENVDNNRLAVSIFSPLGQKLVPTPPSLETISPLLPMPIIHPSYKMTVSHITSSKSLYLQRVSDIPTLQSLLDDLFTFYSTSGRSLSPQTTLESSLCAAQSEDENWYRARIIKPTETGALVQYVDYGNLEEVPSASLKHLESHHLIQPLLALEVSLPVTLKGTEEEQAETLKPLLLDKEFLASLYNIRSKWIAELEDPPGTKISDTLTSQNLIQLPEEPKKPEIDPSEPDDMIVGGKYKIAVTHADNPAQFYIQRLRDVPAIDTLQEKLQEEVLNSPRIEGIPEENLFCAATYSADGLWYRAEVIDADEDIVTVRFVDFGNTDSITDKEGIKQLPESMKSIKRYGIKCRLDLIPAGEEDWSESTCDKFLTMATAEEFIDAVVIADGSPKRLELLVGEENIGEKLVEEKLAIKVHGVEEIYDEIVERELDPRSAFVSHINSPSEFWVQEEKFVGELETIADRFMVADMFPKLQEAPEGTLCVAKFPEDQNWYRARVISHGDTGTNVIYIDYGNSAVSTEIKEIPGDLEKLPPLSRKCCLRMPEGVEQWSEAACEEFSRMADDGVTVFILEVMEEGETSKVKLLLEGEDISVALGELCEKKVAVIEERLSPLGEETSPNVVVSHVVSPSEFWLQADYKMADLDVMADHLANAQSFLPLENLTEGAICAAKFPEDDQWYRAKILCHSESETEVLYIDYGNSAVTSELRALPEDIIKIPHLSMFSSLKLPEDVECWSQEACEKFIELVADGETMFEYEEMSEDDPSLIKLSLNGQDVVEILAPLCEKKKEKEIDEELREEAEKVQNMRDSVFDETSDSFVFHQGGVQVEEKREEMTSEFSSSICEEKVEKEIDEELREEAEKVQNMRDSVFDETSDSFTFQRGEEKGEEMTTKFEEMIIQTESVSSSTSGIEGTATSSDQSSSNISGRMDSSPDVTLQKPEEIPEEVLQNPEEIPEEVLALQNPEEIPEEVLALQNPEEIPEEMLPKPEEIPEEVPTLQNPEEIPEEEVPDTMESIEESCSITKELTADDIVKLFSPPPSEAPDVAGDGEDVSGVGELVVGLIEEVVGDADESEVQIKLEMTQDAEDKGKSISEVSGVDLSESDTDKDDKTFNKGTPEEDTHHSTLLDDQTTPEDISKFSQLTLDETSYITQSTESSEEPDKSISKNIKDLSIDLSQINIDQIKTEVLIPNSPKTPHSEKLVSGVITDHRLLELEKENDEEVLTVETETIPK